MNIMIIIWLFVSSIDGKYTIINEIQKLFPFKWIIPDRISATENVLNFSKLPVTHMKKEDDVAFWKSLIKK